MTAPAAAQEKPRTGGILTWFDYGDPGRLDVHAESPLVVQQATAGIYSGLLHYDPDEPTKVVGDLAERWTVSPDGKTYTFHLRKGVKWHDGQPFSSADVKATFDRVLNPDFKSPKCGASLKPMVASVEAVDANTVEFKLKFAGRAVPALGRVGVVPGRGQAHPGQVRRPELGRGPDRHRAVQVQEVRARQRDRVGEEPRLLHPGPALPRRREAVHPGRRPDPARRGQGRARSCCGTRGRRCARPRPTSWPRARDDVDIYQAPINTDVLHLPEREEAALRQPGPAPRRQPGHRPPGAGGQGARGRGRAVRDPRSRSWSATSRCRSTRWRRRRAAASPRSRTSPRPRSWWRSTTRTGSTSRWRCGRSATTWTARSSCWPSSARSASAARSRPTRARPATPPSARATSRSSPPRTAPWTSTSPPASSTSSYTTEAGSNYGQYSDPKVDELADARAAGRPTATSASSSTGSCSGTS